MAEQKATNIKWHHGKITKEDRAKLLNQKGATIWLTGLSGSGKSTIAVELEHALAAGTAGTLLARVGGLASGFALAQSALTGIIDSAVHPVIALLGAARRTLRIRAVDQAVGIVVARVVTQIWEGASAVHV